MSGYERAEQVSVLERPPLFCAVCGAAMQQTLFGVIRREVWCAERTCKQYERKLNVFDRVLTGDSHVAVDVERDNYGRPV